MSTAKPDETLFSKVEYPDEFWVRFKVRGEISMIVKAADKDDALRKAEAMTEDEEFGLELDEAEDVSVASVYPRAGMFRVLRDGKTVQASWLVEGDEPRDPTDTGF